MIFPHQHRLTNKEQKRVIEASIRTCSFIIRGFEGGHRQAPFTSLEELDNKTSEYRRAKSDLLYYTKELEEINKNIELKELQTELEKLAKRGREINEQIKKLEG